MRPRGRSLRSRYDSAPGTPTRPATTTSLTPQFLLLQRFSGCCNAFCYTGQRVSEQVEAFAFESDEVFRLALDVTELSDEIAMHVRRHRPWVAYQLGRSSLSILNNGAEAHGEHSPGEKAKFYRYAGRSASETAGMVVFLAKRALIPRAVEVRLRRALLETMKILTRRAIHFQMKAR